MQFACLLVVLNVLSSCDQHEVNPELAAANPPQDQVDFCAIIEDRADQYRPLYDQAKTERDPNTLDQLNAQMHGIFRDRNQKALEAVQSHHMHAGEWVTTVQKISHYAQDGGGSVIELNLDAKCRVKTTLQVDVNAASPLAASLADTKVGDPMAITGNFLMHSTETLPPVRVLEWGVTEGRSMLMPEYHIEVSRFGLKPASS